MLKIEEELKSKILVLDGAMGTMLQRNNFSEEDFRGERFKDFPHPLKGNNDLLSITQPEAVKAVHRAYFQAGADIVETNTFSGTTIGMADYYLEDLVYELNFQSAKIAREVADEFTDKPRFVAGSIGPTNRTASMSPDVNDPGYRAVNFDDLRIAYKQQVEALIDGGCDVLLVETIFDTLNAKAIREIDGGKETISALLPLIIGGQKGLVEEKDLRIPNMRGIMTARTKVLTVLEPVGAALNTKAVKFEKPAAKSAVKLVSADNLDELVSLLHNEAKVI